MGDSRSVADAMKWRIELSGTSGGYGSRMVVSDVHLRVARGEVFTLFGHNGAGKTTLLKLIYGLLPARAGTLRFNGSPRAPAEPARDRRRDGMAFIPAERFVFGSLTVEENLEMGLLGERSREVRASRVEETYGMFPVLRERSSQLAGTLSGGQQRMLILGAALISRPNLLLMDEPSLGLAPVLVSRIFDDVKALAERSGISVIMVEQNVAAALRISDRVGMLRNGQLIRQMPAAEMAAVERTEWWKLF